MNFLALVIIAEFDDYFFKTVAHEMYGELISCGEIPIYDYDLELPENVGSAKTFEEANVIGI